MVLIQQARPASGPIRLPVPLSLRLTANRKNLPPVNHSNTPRPSGPQAGLPVLGRNRPVCGLKGLTHIGPGSYIDRGQMPHRLRPAGLRASGLKAWPLGLWPGA